MGVTWQVARLFAFFVGLTTGEPFFEAGKEYQFNYEASIVSGIPDLGSHYAGMVLTSRVILQALNQSTFQLALQDVKFKNFNEKTEGEKKLGWQYLELPDPEDVAVQYSPILESPVLFKMEFGEILEIQVDEYEPQWSLNIKKSLLALLKVRVDDNDDEPATFMSRQMLPSFWEVMEDGLDGICLNSYQMAEIPAHLLVEPWLNHEALEKCTDRMFKIVKTRDMNSCLQRAVYQSNQPGRYRCPQGNCDAMFELSSLTQYIGCGSSLSTMEIVAVMSEQGLHQSLLAYNTEKVLTGSKQVLEMININSTFSTLPVIEDVRMIEDLLYEYPEAVTLTESSMFPQEEKPSSYKEQQDFLQSKTENIRVQRFDKALPQDQETILSKLSPAVLQQQLVDKLTAIVGHLTANENLEKKEVSSQLMSLTKVFSLLSTDHMMELYKTIKNLNMTAGEDELTTQLLLEISVLSGSNPAIMFLKDLIEMREISPLRTGMALSTLPHYIKTPTVQVLDQLFDLIQSPVIKQSMWIKTNAELAFAMILNRACVDSYRERRFPVDVFGEFCDPNTPELINKYIPFFVDQLNEAKSLEERLSLIIVLGTISHESVLPVLLPFMERKKEGMSVAEQRMAVYALHGTAREFRDVILPVYMSLIHNSAEERSVRIGALTTLVYTQPDTFDFQQLAASTWSEPDSEFHKFVSTLLKSLSEIKSKDQPASTTFHKLAQKARLVFPLVKPVSGIIPSTLSSFTSEWLDQLQIGYRSHSYLTSLLSFRSLYVKVEFMLEQLKYSPIEMGMRTQGIGRLMEKLGRAFEEHAIPVEHPTWKELAAQLQLKFVKSVPFQAGFWSKIYDDIQLMAGFGHDLDSSAVDWIRTLISDTKQKLCGRIPINFVKVNNWMPREILIPSSTGLPILMEVHMPGVLAAIGVVDIDCSTVLPSITLDVSLKASVNQVGYVGTLCPFTKEMVAVGIDEQSVQNFPVRLQVRAEQGSYKLLVAPSGQVKNSERNIDLLVYHVKPFAVIKPLEFLDFTPMTLHPDVKHIQSENERRISMRKLGKSTGIDIRYIVETEGPLWDTRARMDQMALFDFSSINMFLFGWTNTALTLEGKPSARYHQISVFYSPADSQTQEAQVQLSLYQSSKKNEEEAKRVGFLLSTDAYVATFKKQLENVIHNKTLVNWQLSIMQVYLMFKGRELSDMLLMAGAVQGNKQGQNHWACHLINRVNSEKKGELCMVGSLSLPDGEPGDDDMRRWPQVLFEHNLGLGSDCSQFMFKASGLLAVSDEQRNMALNSREHRQCVRTTGALKELRTKLASANYSSSDKDKLQRRIQQTYGKNHASCQASRDQMNTLDKLTIHFLHNYPLQLKPWYRFNWLHKDILLFQTSLEELPSSNDIHFDAQFRPHGLDVALSSLGVTKTFSNIRLPHILRNMVSWPASKYPGEQLLQKITGLPTFATCWIGDGLVRTLRSQSYSYSPDDCYHVLAADCSTDLRHAVLLREVGGSKELQILYGQSEIHLRCVQDYGGNSSREFELTVDGKKVPFEMAGEKDFSLKDGVASASVSRSPEGTLILTTPHHRIKYNGQTVELAVSQILADGHLCGICGNLDGRLQTAQQCQPQILRTAALSFRIQTDSCSPMNRSNEANNQLSCQSLPDMDSDGAMVRLFSYPDQQVGCAKLRHVVVRVGSQVCLSQQAVMECGQPRTGCTVRARATKMVPFVCLPPGRDRVGQLYVTRAARGEMLAELKSLEVRFTAEMDLPTACTHIAL